MSDMRHALPAAKRLYDPNHPISVTDVAIVAEAIVSACPEDDETLVDPAWFGSLKNGRVNGRRFRLFDEESGNGLVLFVNPKSGKLSVTVSDHDGHFCRLHSLYGNATRGDVRLLAKAMRLDLGEQR